MSDSILPKHCILFLVSGDFFSIICGHSFKRKTRALCPQRLPELKVEPENERAGACADRGHAVSNTKHTAVVGFLFTTTGGGVAGQ